MKLNFKLLVGVAIIAGWGLASCGGGGGGTGVSSTTNWYYNDPENGGFEVAEYREQQTGPGLVLIEGGTFLMGRTQQDITYDWNNIPRQITVGSYYMDQTEIKNVDYREYLHWLNRVFEDNKQIYRNALPDTLVWRSRLAYNEPFVEYYFRHPAYHNYPVVGVSWIQASEYCLWRTDRVNENLLVQEGVLDHNPADQKNENNFTTEAYLAGQYEGLVNKNLPSLDPDAEDRPVKMEDGILLPRYRLPTEAEWEYAALALIGNTVAPERIYGQRIYPWNGHYLRNSTKNYRGQFMANMKRGKGDMMGVAGALNDNAAITAPVDSYWPNDYGLYCMAGNVNEWVLDVYRPMSLQDVDDFRPFRGNVFMKKKRDANGDLLPKDSLGRIQYEAVTDQESMNRYNYKTADNINYNDGDLQSRIVLGGDWNTGTDKDGTGGMYYQGKANNQGMTSLITDKSRVYKGGSWRDRAYWLVPGTRRFLDERLSRNDIGFRCAMTRVGSQTGI